MNVKLGSINVVVVCGINNYTKTYRNLPCKRPPVIASKFKAQMLAFIRALAPEITVYTFRGG